MFAYGNAIKDSTGKKAHVRDLIKQHIEHAMAKHWCPKVQAHKLQRLSLSLINW